MQRLTSDFWVSATVRRVFGDGGFAAVIRRGSTEAGAIYVTCRTRLGETLLYGPAAQAAYESERPEGRLFSLLMRSDDDATVAERLEREVRFDPDLWLVELECEESKLASYLDLVTP